MLLQQEAAASSLLYLFVACATLICLSWFSSNVRKRQDDLCCHAVSVPCLHSKLSFEQVPDSNAALAGVFCVAELLVEAAIAIPHFAFGPQNPILDRDG